MVAIHSLNSTTQRNAALSSYDQVDTSDDIAFSKFTSFQLDQISTSLSYRLNASSSFLFFLSEKTLVGNKHIDF